MEDLREILKKHLPLGNSGPGAATSPNVAPEGSSRSANGAEGAHKAPAGQAARPMDGVTPAADAVCLVCDGLGWLRRDVPVDDADFGKLFACECRQKRFDAERFGRFLRVSNLGHLAGMTFESLKGVGESLKRAGGTSAAGGANGRRLNPGFDHALKAAQEYAAHPDGWFTLVGPVGCGKTTLAAAIATEVMRSGTPAFFMSVADLLDHLRSTYSPTSDVTYDELAEQVREVPLLVLDDLGSQSATQWAQEKLWQILGHRYNARIPTVITTDMPLGSMDDRLRPRLMNAALVKVVEVGDILVPGSSAIDSLGLQDLAHMTFDSFSATGLSLRGPIAENLAEAKRLAAGFAQQPDGWLVLTGGYGCGKTHLAAAIAHYRRQQGESVLFVFVTDLLDYLRSTFQSESNSTYQVIDRVKRVGLLILDDFSEPADTAWTREKLYQVLNYRYLTKLPTVITSGIEPELLEPRIWSRMNDSRLSTVYEILAPDYRTGVSHRARRPPSGDRRPPARGRLSTRRSADEREPPG